MKNRLLSLLSLLFVTFLSVAQGGRVEMQPKVDSGIDFVSIGIGVVIGIIIGFLIAKGTKK